MGLRGGLAIRLLALSAFACLATRATAMYVSRPPPHLVRAADVIVIGVLEDLRTAERGRYQYACAVLNVKRAIWPPALRDRQYHIVWAFDLDRSCRPIQPAQHIGETGVWFLSREPHFLPGFRRPADFPPEVCDGGGVDDVHGLRPVFTWAECRPMRVLDEVKRALIDNPVFPRVGWSHLPAGYDMPALLVVRNPTRAPMSVPLIRVGRDSVTLDDAFQLRIAGYPPGPEPHFARDPLPLPARIAFSRASAKVLLEPGGEYRAPISLTRICAVLPEQICELTFDYRDRAEPMRAVFSVAKGPLPDELGDPWTRFALAPPKGWERRPRRRLPPERSPAGALALLGGLFLARRATRVGRARAAAHHGCPFAVTGNVANGSGSS